MRTDKLHIGSKDEAILKFTHDFRPRSRGFHPHEEEFLALSPRNLNLVLKFQLLGSLRLGLSRDPLRDPFRSSRCIEDRLQIEMRLAMIGEAVERALDRSLVAELRGCAKRTEPGGALAVVGE